MKYKDYQLQDFLQDEHFISWVFNPDEETRMFWKNWIASHPEKLPVIQQAKEIISSAQFKSSVAQEHDKEEVLAKILKGYTSKYHYQITQSKKTRSIIFKLAASIALVCLLGFAFYDFVNDNPLPAEPEIVRNIIKSNPAGQKSQITLPDGSKVYLNAASQLTFPEKFKNTREVTLSGEAFFEVIADSTKPFIVQTRFFRTRVLGTSFNVNDNSVALLTGKVTVYGDGENSHELILTPGQKAVHDTEKNSIFKTPYNYQKEMGWKDGLIYFEDASFEAVKLKLEQWYGVTIKVGEGVNTDWTYTGTFDNESLHRVLERLGYMENFRFEIKKDVVLILKPK